MAECLAQFNHGEKVTILTATSGDTGAAVAHAFYNKPNIDVVILYPKGKISLAQQKLFTTLGDNIHCYAIEGSFDDCQELVKKSFLDEELKAKLGLNSLYHFFLQHKVHVLNMIGKFKKVKQQRSRNVVR